eukprot:11155575-Lingulodinium_polyedra.AAC.1
MVPLVLQRRRRCARTQSCGRLVLHGCTNAPQSRCRGVPQWPEWVIAVRAEWRLAGRGDSYPHARSTSK